MNVTSCCAVMVYCAQTATAVAASTDVTNHPLRTTNTPYFFFLAGACCDTTTAAFGFNVLFTASSTSGAMIR
jgi:hypothetical protein